MFRNFIPEEDGMSTPPRRHLRGLVVAAAAFGALLIGATAASAAATFTQSWTVQPPEGALVPGSANQFTLHIDATGTPTSTAGVVITTFQSQGSASNLTAPAGWVCEPPDPIGISCSIPADNPDGDLSFTLNVPRQLVPSFTLVSSLATFPGDLGAGDLSSSAYTVSSGGPSSIAITAPVSTPDNDHVAVGGTLSHTFTIANTGTGPADDVTLIARGDINGYLPTAATPGDCSTVPNGVRCNVGTIPAGGSVELNVSGIGAEINPNGSFVGVELSSKDDDGVDTRTFDSVGVFVTDGTTTALTIVERDLPATVPSGGALTYNFDIANGGPSDVVGRDIQFSGFNFPGSLIAPIFTSASVGSVDCAPDPALGTRVWICPFDLPAGQATTLTINATAPIVTADIATGVFVNIHTVSYVPGGQQGGTTNANSFSTIVASVASSADLGVSATTPASAELTAGGEVSVTVTNAGPSEATSVVLNGTLNDGTVWISGPANCNGGAGLPCNIGTLAAGTSATVTFRVHGAAVGTPSSVGLSVAGAQPDAVTGNNTANVAFATLPDPAVVLEASVVNPLSLTLRTLGGGSAAIITCNRDCSASVVLSISNEVARRAKIPVVPGTTSTVIGSGQGSITTTGSFTVNAKVADTALARLIKRGKSFTMTRTTTVTTPDGDRVVVSQPVVVNRRAR